MNVLSNRLRSIPSHCSCSTKLVVFNTQRIFYKSNAHQSDMLARFALCRAYIVGPSPSNALVSLRCVGFVAERGPRNQFISIQFELHSKHNMLRKLRFMIKCGFEFVVSYTQILVQRICCVNFWYQVTVFMFVY